MLVESPTEAYKWWNTMINPLKSDISPPKCISPKEATEVWKKNFPIFLFLTCDDLSLDKYWNKIVEIISPFSISKDIPNPITSFPEFIVFLYQSRFYISPQNVSQCIKLMSCYNDNNIFGNFFLYNMPIFVFNPILYFRSVLEVCEKGSPIWPQFLSNHSVSDAFFDLHVSFLQPISAPVNSEKWTHHLVLGEILYRQITLTLRSNPNSISNSNKFSDYLLRLISSSPSFVRMNATRWFLSLTKLTLKKNEKNILRDKIKQFLSILAGSNDIFIYSIKFIKDNLISLTKPAKLINKIMVNSLPNIDIILSFTEQAGPMIPIARLAKGSIESKTWHRAAFSAMIEIIKKYSENNELKDWLTVYIRRILIFVSLSNISQKYKVRALLIVESMSRLVSIRIKWIKQLILNIAFTLINSKNVPNYFSSFFFSTISHNMSHCIIDEETSHELDAFQRCIALINLKTFPFDVKKSTFISPPQSDNNHTKNNNHTSLSSSPLSGRSIHIAPALPLLPGQRSHLLQINQKKQPSLQLQSQQQQQPPSTSLKTTKKKQHAKKAAKKKSPTIKKPQFISKLHNQRTKQ